MDSIYIEDAHDELELAQGNSRSFDANVHSYFAVIAPGGGTTYRTTSGNISLRNGILNGRISVQDSTGNSRMVTISNNRLIGPNQLNREEMQALSMLLPRNLLLQILE